jgi:hypothetical protein
MIDAITAESRRLPRRVPIRPARLTAAVIDAARSAGG